MMEAISGKNEHTKRCTEIVSKRIGTGIKA